MAYKGFKADIPAGNGSLNSEGGYLVPPTDITVAESICYEDGVWRKLGGASLFDAVPGATGLSLVALFDWRPTSAVQRVVWVGSNGVIYKEVGGDLDNVTLASGLSASTRGMFYKAGAEVTGNPAKLFYFDGIGPVKVLSGDGATMGNISAPPEDWTGSYQPVGGVLHGNRLWGFGNLNSPHSIYSSGPRNHEDFLCAEATDFMVSSGIGERIVGAVSLNEVLYMVKYPNGVFYLDDADPRPQYWQIKKVTETVGAANSPYALLALPNDAMLLDADGGFHLISRVAESGANRQTDLADAIRIKTWIRNNVNITRLNQAQSCWYENKSTAVWALPSKNSAINDLLVYFDFSSFIEGTGGVKFAYSTRDVAQGLTLRRDTDGIAKPIVGDNAGGLWILDRDTRVKATDGYLAAYKTADTDFGFVDAKLASLEKNFDFLEIFANAVGPATVSVDVYVDGAFKRTVAFDLTSGHMVHRLKCHGRSISFRVSNAMPGEDFSIVNHRVWFRPSGES